MPLTPEDVSNKRFTPVRLREGYDMGEVDQFLDEVEEELNRLIAERNELREKLSAAQGGRPVETTSTSASKSGSVKVGSTESESAKSDAAKPDSSRDGAVPTDSTKSEPGSSDQGATTGSAAAAAPRETIKVVTAAEASSAALRLLELAAKNSDEVVAEAKEEAEQIVSAARSEAERLESDTVARADTLEQQARSRAQNLDEETTTRRDELLGDVQKEKARLDAEVDTLRAFEREYRSRLRSYFSEQLQSLDGIPEGGAVVDSTDPLEPSSTLVVTPPADGPAADEPGESVGEDQPRG